jgi:hypothetical protein
MFWITCIVSKLSSLCKRWATPERKFRIGIFLIGASVGIIVGFRIGSNKCKCQSSPFSGRGSSELYSEHEDGVKQSRAQEYLLDSAIQSAADTESAEQRGSRERNSKISESEQILWDYIHHSDSD